MADRIGIEVTSGGMDKFLHQLKVAAVTAQHLNKELASLAKSIDKADNEAKQLATTQNKVQSETKQSAAATKKYDSEIARLNKRIESLDRKLKGVTRTKKKLNDTTKASGKAMATFNNEVLNAVPGLNRLNGASIATRAGFVLLGAVAVGAMFNLGRAVINASKELDIFQTQFKVILGSAEAAETRLKELANFAATTPFQLDSVAKASKTLEIFTKGALSAGEGLRLVGDAAALSTGSAAAGFQSLALWIGRAYDGLQSGRPIGRAMMRLQMLALVSGDARNEIEALAEAGKGKEGWEVLRSELQKAEGQMVELSKTGAGLESTIRDLYKEVLRQIGSGGAYDGYKEALEGIRDTMFRMVEDGSFKRMGENISEWIGHISNAIGVLDELGKGLDNLKKSTDEYAKSVSLNLPAVIDEMKKYDETARQLQANKFFKGEQELWPHTQEKILESIFNLNSVEKELKDVEKASNDAGVGMKQFFATLTNQGAMDVGVNIKEKTIKEESSTSTGPSKKELSELAKIQKEILNERIANNLLYAEEELKIEEEKYRKQKEILVRHGESTAQLEELHKARIMEINISWDDKYLKYKEEQKKKEDAITKDQIKEENEIIKQKEEELRELELIEKEITNFKKDILAERFQNNLVSIDEELALEQSRYQAQKAQLMEHHEAMKELNIGNAEAQKALLIERNKDTEDIEKIHAANVDKIKQKSADKDKFIKDIMEANARKFVNAAGQLIAQSVNNEKAAANVKKGIAIAEIVYDTYQAAADTYKTVSNEIGGTAGVVAGTAAAALVVGAGVANVAIVAGTDYKEGGIAEDPANTSVIKSGGVVRGPGVGDQVKANLDGGELISNKKQQQKMMEVVGITGGVTRENQDTLYKFLNSDSPVSNTINENGVINNGDSVNNVNNNSVNSINRTFNASDIITGTDSLIDNPIVKDSFRDGGIARHDFGIVSNNSIIQPTITGTDFSDITKVEPQVFNNSPVTSFIEQGGATPIRNESFNNIDTNNSRTFNDTKSNVVNNYYTINMSNGESTTGSFERIEQLKDDLQKIDSGGGL